MCLARVGYNVGAFTAKKTLDFNWWFYGMPLRVAYRQTELPRKAAVDAVAELVAPLFAVTAEVIRSPPSGVLQQLRRQSDHDQQPCVSCSRLTTGPVMSVQDIELDEVRTAPKAALPTEDVDSVNSGSEVPRDSNRIPTNLLQGAHSWPR